MLPYEIRNQIIQVIGLCFHFKDNVEAFFISCGINRDLVIKYRDLPKFVWAKNVFADLDRSEEGIILQKRILTELCKFRQLPDKDAPNPDAGIDALRRLKTLAIEKQLIIEEKKKESSNRENIQKEKLRIIENRKNELESLRYSFNLALMGKNRQEAGYILEDILEKLFPLFELEYRKSYKTDTQQIDGFFSFDSFDYLVEAKWRKDQPNEGEIAGFKRKIDTKLESTRGVFISINGIRDEVILRYNGQGNNIIFIDGADITFILEGRIDLREALRQKIGKAAQEGTSFYSISKMI